MKELFTTDLTIGNLALGFDILDILLKFILPILAFFFIYRLLLFISKRIIRIFKLKEEKEKVIFRWTRFTLRFLFVMGIVFSLGYLTGGTLNKTFLTFMKVLTEPFFETGKTKVSFVTLLLLIPVFMLASWAGRVTRRLMEDSQFLRKTPLDKARQFSLISVTRYIVMTLVFLFGLNIIGIDLSAITVILSVLGLGIGFGLQGIVGNFTAGLVIILIRPIKEGDQIVVDGHEGVIEQITLLNTEIRTLDNKNLIIPNAQIVNNPVYNYSHKDQEIVIENEVGVAYSTDIPKALALLRQARDKVPGVRRYSRDNVERLREFGDSGILLVARTRVENLNNRFQVHHDINLAIWRLFKEHGVEIPFPQVDLHIKSQPMGGPPVTISREQEEKK